MKGVLLGAGVLTAACVQASTGLGFALVLTPIALALLSPVGAILVVTVLGLVLNVLVLTGERRRPRIAWDEVVPIVAAAVPGTVVGVLVLQAISKRVLEVAVGAMLIAAIAARRLVPAEPHAGAGGRSARLALGVASGALTTSTGVNGPPVALWLARRGLSPEELRDSLSAMFLAFGLIGCVALTPVLHRASLDPWLLLAGAACVVAGHAVGSRLFARIRADRYEGLLNALILAAGIASVAAGLGAR
jgi:uncharacterized membrane protein YfcA